MPDGRSSGVGAAGGPDANGAGADDADAGGPEGGTDGVAPARDARWTSDTAGRSELVARSDDRTVATRAGAFDGAVEAFVAVAAGIAVDTGAGALAARFSGCRGDATSGRESVPRSAKIITATFRTSSAATIHGQRRAERMVADAWTVASVGTRAG